MRQHYPLKEKEQNEEKLKEIYGALLRHMGLRQDNFEMYKNELYDAFFPIMVKIKQITDKSKVPQVLRRSRNAIDEVLCSVEGIPTKIWLEEREMKYNEEPIIEYGISLGSYLGIGPYHPTPDNIPAPNNVKILLKTYNRYIHIIGDICCSNDEPRQERIVFIDENCPDRVYAEIKYILEGIGNIGKLRNLIKKELEEVVKGEWLGLLFNQ